MHQPLAAWCFLPELINLGDNAFTGCSSLTNLNLPRYHHQPRLRGAFPGTALTNVRLPCLCSPTSTTIFFPIALFLTNITFPANITAIYDSAFFGCSSLRHISIPASSVTLIGNDAFYNTGLTNLTISSNLTFIGQAAFAQCSNLTTVTLSPGLLSIGDSMFQACSNLVSISIPDSVTNCSEYAFEFCDHLGSATIGNGLIYGNDA